MIANLKNYNFIFLNCADIFENKYKVGLNTFILACGLRVVKLIQGDVYFFDAPRPWQMSFQQPATPLMEAIIDLHHNIMAIMIFIVIFISYILLRAVWLFNSKRRGIEEIPKLSKTRHYLSLEVIWTIIPMIILFFISVPSFALLYSMDNCPKPELTFKVIGRQWYWSYESDFFIQRPLPSFSIEKDYKFNLCLYFFKYYFTKAIKHTDYHTYTIRNIDVGICLENAHPVSLDYELKNILHNILIPALLKNKINMFEGGSEYIFEDHICEAYAHDFYKNLMFECGIKENNISAYKKLFGKFSKYNLDIEDNSTVVSLETLEKSSNFLDYLKYYLLVEKTPMWPTTTPVSYCSLEEGCKTLPREEDLRPTFFEVLSFKATYLCYILQGLDIEVAVNRCIQFLKLREDELPLEPELRRILTNEFLEDSNNIIFKNQIKITTLNNPIMTSGFTIYYGLNRSTEFLKTNIFFSELYNHVFSLLSTIKKSKGFDSYIAFFNFMIDKDYYIILKRSLEKDQLTLLSFLKLMVDWHKKLYDILMILDESPSLPYLAKNGDHYVNCLFKLARNQAMAEKDYGNSYHNSKSGEYPENDLGYFLKKNKKLDLAFKYYNKLYTEFDLVKVTNVCNLFNLDKLTTNYLKQILTCNFYFKYIFEDSTDHLKILFHSFNLYHEVFPILKITQKETIKNLYTYKHISVDFDSCILTDNEVYSIFKKLCINEDILDLDKLPTDFCGWYRLLEVDKRLILPIQTRIRLLVTSSDVLHSWAVPSLGIKIDACPGRLNCVYVYIYRPGVFHGQCSELCGVKHGFMPIVVHGVYKDKFNFWVSSIGEFVPKSIKLINA